MYDRVIRRKRQRGWHNLTIAPRTVERLLHSDKWYDLSLPPDRLNPTEFRQIRELEDVAVDLITEYADRFWRTRRRRWEHDRIEVVTLNQDDPNNVEAYEISVDAAEDRLVEEACELAAHVREGRYDDLKTWYGHLQVGVICTRLHAYQPFLHVRTDHVVTVQPVPLDEHEKRVVEGLAGLAQRGAACLDGKELFLIRNLTRGRGVSFFDDFGYYPDFIVWLKDRRLQHVLFLDPKGLSRFGRKERHKVQLHHEIAKIENRIRRDEPDLRLRAYVLSVTPAAHIDDGLRSVREWKKDGVYFLNEPDCLQQVVEHALEPTPAA